MRLLPCTVRPRLGIFSDGTGSRGIAWPGTLAQTERRQDGAHYNRLAGMANKYFGDRHRAPWGKETRYPSPTIRSRHRRIFTSQQSACPPRQPPAVACAVSLSPGRGGFPVRSSKHSNPCLLLFYCARLCRLSWPLGDGPRRALHIHSRLRLPRRHRPATGRKNRPVLSIGWVVADLCNAVAAPGAEAPGTTPGWTEHATSAASFRASPNPSPAADGATPTSAARDHRIGNLVGFARNLQFPEIVALPHVDLVRGIR